MPRETIHQLAERLHEETQRSPAKAYFRHQTTNTIYQITGLAIREANGEALINYRPTQYDGEPFTPPINPSKIVFSRPADEFHENITWIDMYGGKRQGPRFVRVERAEAWVEKEI